MLLSKFWNRIPNKVLLFHGEMGVGKTTLIKVLAKALGVEGATSSPTFSLVNEYQSIDNQIVYHFDFYRLKNETEALDMGADEYLYSGNWCFIEWAEKNSEPHSRSTFCHQHQSASRRQKVVDFNFRPDKFILI